MLQNFPITPEHRAAEQLDGRETLLQEGIVEFLECKFVAAQLLIVLTQFENLQFAERVDEVRRVRRTSFGLALGVRPRLVTFVDEEFDSLWIGHLSSVQLDADDEAGIAQQSVLQLAESELEVA